MPPLVFAGIVLLARRRMHRLSASAWMDGAAAALAAAALGAAVVVDAFWRARDGAKAPRGNVAWAARRRPSVV